jgi:Short C-terminal domain
MDFLTWIFLICMIGFVLAAIQMWNTSNKKHEMWAGLDAQADFSATQRFIGCDGNSGIAIDELREKIGLISNNQNSVSIRIVSYRDLLSSEIFEDGSMITKTSRSSQLGGALLGGVLLGGVGAIIGGLSGKTETTGKVKRLDLRIVVSDTANPIHDVVFQNVEDKKGGLIHNLALQEARHWHGLIDVLIKRAENEDQKITEAKPNASIADELKKLAELKTTGVLTEAEFQQQKEILLRR